MAQSDSLHAEIDSLSHILSLVEAFRAFDSDNDGSITAAELGGILGSVGYKASEEDVRAMMQQGDTNKDGLLSIQEFLEMNTKDMKLGGLANCLKTALEVLNADGDVIVTPEELYEVAGNEGFELPLDVCQNIIASLDEDGDGVASLEDLQLIVSSLF